MSNDDKTIITFRRDGSSGNGGAVPGGGFQRPMPGGRGAKPEPKPMQAAVQSTIQPAAQPAPIQPIMGVPPVTPVSKPAAITPSMAAQPTASSAASAQGFSLPPPGQGNTSAVFINPLVHCANDVIDRMASLKCSALGNNAINGGDASVRDPSLFRDETVRQIRDFEWRCGQQGIDEESTLYARYIICTVLDEFATKTPWGGNGVWSSQSLLSQFHDETGGGEKFFQILEHLQTQPATYLPVLELMYISMSLGFEGKYSLENRGNVEIENLRDNLFHLMRLQRGEAERDLSPHWQGVSEKRYTLMKHIPVWVFSAIAGVVLLVLYSGFSYQLTTSKDQVLAALQEPVAEYLPVDMPVEDVSENPELEESSNKSSNKSTNKTANNPSNQEPK